MKWKLTIVAALAAAATTIIGQQQTTVPRDDAYVSTYRPTLQANASAGLPAVPISKLIVSTRDMNTLHAATWIGVYETTNGGTSWHLFGQGLPVVTVSDLYMPTDASYLRVSTYGRGVWETRF